MTQGGKRRISWMTQIRLHLSHLTIGLRAKRRQWANLGGRRVAEWKYVDATELQVHIGTRTRGIPHGRSAARMKKPQNNRVQILYFSPDDSSENVDGMEAEAAVWQANPDSYSPGDSMLRFCCCFFWGGFWDKHGTPPPGSPHSSPVWARK